MSWPPPKRFWERLVPDLPPNTDLKVFAAKVRTVAGVYLNNESGETELYDDIYKQLHGVDLERFAKTLENLKALPCLFRPQVIDQVALWPLHELLEYSRGRRAYRKYYGLKRNREGRLYFNLLWVLHETGLPWSNSDSGPTMRVFKSITDHLLPKPLTARAVKDIVIRHARQH